MRRILVAWMLDDRCPMTVADLADRLVDAGFSVTGRPSKVVSDSLRWEIGRGRVVRLRRGTYAVRSMPRSTDARIRRQGIALLRAVHPATSSPEADQLAATASAALAAVATHAARDPDQMGD